MSYAGGIAALRYFSLLCWLVVSASVPLLIVGGIWSQSNPPKEGWNVSLPPQDVLMTDRDYKNTRPVSRDYIPYALRQGYRRATHDQAADWLREQAFTPRTGPLGFTPMGLANFAAIGLLVGLVSTLVFRWLQSLLERRETATVTANRYAAVAPNRPRRVYWAGPRAFVPPEVVVDGEVVERSPQPPPALTSSMK